MKLSSTLVLLFSSTPLVQAAPCPFARTGADTDYPNDEVHSGLNRKNSIRRRRMVSLSDDPETKQKLNSIITNRKQRSLTETCFSAQTYDDIDADIANLADAFTDNVTKGFFLGGLVRLAAHDFLDYNINATTDAYGPDGCIDFASPENAGLDQIWCDECDLTAVWEASYSHISRADFWVAAAHAVIRQTSSDGLDLKDSFVWGRVDRDVCANSAERLPAATSCAEVEEVFLDRLGLSYTDAVALIGAHTLGRGDADFSGHDGIWVDTVEESLVFDKRFYEEIFRRAWVPRNTDTDVQDWTWGNQNVESPRFMLNTDMCLLFDIEQSFPCCTRTDRNNTNGVNPCQELNETECVAYDDSNPRKAAADAVELFATGGGRSISNTDNEPFYEAFEAAWVKATTNGWANLNDLDTCVTSSPTPSPTSDPSGQPSLAPSIPPVPSMSPVSSMIPTESSCYPLASTVKLESTTGEILNAFEIEVYAAGQNIAIDGTATQSSTHNEKSKFDASSAIDGDDSTFIHTDASDDSPWWQVGFTLKSEIESVEIKNRWCGDENDQAECLCRMSDAKLSLLDDLGSLIAEKTLGDTCEQLTLSLDFDTNFNCSDATPSLSPVAGTTYPEARVLKLYSSTGEPINMYEFQVISSGTNVAEGKTTMQSSTLKDKFPASYAVDGDASTFSHTETEDFNWFVVDLEDSFAIESVEIANRWCGNENDASSCLCRLSHAVLSLYDDSGEWIATVSLGNTCGTIDWTYDFSDYASSSCTAWS